MFFFWDQASTITSSSPTPTMDYSMTRPSLSPLPSSALLVDEVKDIVQVMKRQEATIYARPMPPAVPNFTSSSQGDAVGETDDVPSHLFRGIILKWMYNVANVFSINHQAVAVATYYLDRAVADPSIVQSPIEYQLASLTALHMALKLYGNKMFPLSELVKLGRGQFTKEHVAAMERRIVHTMKWHLTPPTSHCFLIQFERLFPDSESSDCAKEVLGERAQQLILDAVFHENGHSRVEDFPPSTIACAAMLLAMEQKGRGLLTLEDFETFLCRLQTVAELRFDSIGLLDDAIRFLDPNQDEGLWEDDGNSQESRDQVERSAVGTHPQTPSPSPRNSVVTTLLAKSARGGGGEETLTPSSSSGSISKVFNPSPTSVQEGVDSPRHVTIYR